MTKTACRQCGGKGEVRVVNKLLGGPYWQPCGECHDDTGRPDIAGMKLIINQSVPKGEIHIRDSATGRMLGKMINVQ